MNYKKMNYEEAKQFILDTSKTGSILGLATMKNLMEHLQNVHNALPVIHITGTNGKGSVGAYLASIFKHAGLITARYCSPAVFDELEVFQYDGCNITQEEYADIMSQVKYACDIITSEGGTMPTVFEVETAAAFVWFYQKKPDIVLLEVGMGGSTDATNVIRQPLASVITTISLDHMKFLGNTLYEIATVKAGIIKESCPVFSASQEEEAMRAIKEASSAKKAPLMVVSEKNIHIQDQQPGKLCIQYDTSKGERFLLTTSMAGGYQKDNMALAVEVAQYILTQSCRASNTVIAEWIVEGIQNTVWPGRFEVIGTHPYFILDGAHNEDAARKLSCTVKACFGQKKLTLIIGVLADKEHRKMLQIMLPHASRVFTITPDNPRALDGKRLAGEAMQFHSDVCDCTSVAEAVRRALEFDEPVLAFGSLSYLKEVKKEYSLAKAASDDA